ncbi:SPOR domain-containing protein [Marinoscillum pacificum]|uniref:SPOR domain-containing protein n=1 Tax=Marinoscillum pacificum TaxID=392723 RepID=UPI0021576106|nr:SPOR domain-containing protein [Marinoscillum pacificum]
MSESPNNTGKIVGISLAVVIVIVGIVAGWYGFIYLPEQEAKEKAKQEQLAKEAAAKKAAEKLERDNANYEQLIKDGDDAFAQEDWQTAYDKYTEASGIFSDRQHPKDQLVIVNQKLAEIAEREARRAAAIVERINARTGRYYVIVSSSIDEDLALDFANKTAKEGNLVKIIRHETDKHIFFRVSLGDFASKEQADAAIGNFSSYGEDVWVLPY